MSKKGSLWLGVVKETFPVLVTSGLGLLVAGFALEYVEGFGVVQRHPALIAMIPTLLGLKCNLEMTLASRLGTAFHLGFITKENSRGSNEVIVSNFAVTQIQALVVSILSVLIVEVKHWIYLNFDIHRSLFLLATGIVAASATTMVLAILTTTILYWSTTQSIDPDNVLGPLVASFGDLIAILSLVFVGSLFEYWSGFFLILLIISILVLLPPGLLRLANLHAKTTKVLEDGWRPLLLGLMLSSIAGFFLEDGLQTLDGGISIFIPVINGIGGNIGGIYSSRTSSALHKKVDDLKEITKITPVEIVLTLLPLPVHSIFLFIVGVFFSRARVFNFTFVGLFLLTSIVQVILLLALAKYLTRLAWGKGLDPDNHVVPYLTATADAIGTASIVLISTIV